VTLETGLFSFGILAQGDQAVFEAIFAGTLEGEKVAWLAQCVYEFSGGKIQHMRAVYDRLSIL
jgi:predicted ester cyclase